MQRQRWIILQSYDKQLQAHCLGCGLLVRRMDRMQIALMRRPGIRASFSGRPPANIV